jgi:hypothetical protein
MHAQVPGYDNVQICHCPCKLPSISQAIVAYILLYLGTGRIGDLDFTNIPCLLSQSNHELLSMKGVSNKRYKSSKGSSMTSKRTTSFTQV